MTTEQPPVALALVRRSDGLILTLQGLLKVDMPGSHLAPGDDEERVLRTRLQQLGVHAPRLRLIWQAVAAWAGCQRIVTVRDASGWSGTPIDSVLWSTEADICKGQRAELYRRFFGRMRERGEIVDHARVGETPFAKPKPPACPRCGCPTTLRNRKPGQDVRFDCRACSSSFALTSGGLERVPGLG